MEHGRDASVLGQVQSLSKQSLIGIKCKAGCGLWQSVSRCLLMVRHGPGQRIKDIALLDSRSAYFVVEPRVASAVRFHRLLLVRRAGRPACGLVHRLMANATL